MLLGYTVAKPPTSPRDSTWFTRPFLLVRGWGLETRLAKGLGKRIDIFVTITTMAVQGLKNLKATSTNNSITLLFTKRLKKKQTEHKQDERNGNKNNFLRGEEIHNLWCGMVVCLRVLSTRSVVLCGVWEGV